MVCAMPPKSNTRGQRSVPGGGSTIGREASTKAWSQLKPRWIEASDDGRTRQASAIAVARVHVVDAVR